MKKTQILKDLLSPFLTVNIHQIFLELVKSFVAENSILWKNICIYFLIFSQL